MPRGKAHPDGVKAQVMAALLAGQGVTEVATQYHLDPSVVSRWRSSLGTGKLHEVATKTQDKFGDLLATYLTESLTTLTAQVRFFRDEDWLRKQSAAEVGTLHGIVTDKAIRLLEAVERAYADPDPDLDPATGAADVGV